MISVALTLTQSWHRVPGGTARSALDLSRALAERDDIEVVGIGAGGRRHSSPEFELPVPSRQLRLPYQLLYDAWHYSRLQAPESISGPVDIVHATTTLIPPTRAAPLVVTVHDLFPFLEPEVLTRRGGRILRRGIELARERAAMVCCPSEQTAADCVDAGFDQARLRVVPWAVDHEPVGPNQVDAVRSKHSLDRPYLLWVGTVEPRKNLGVLLDAFRQADLDEVDLVLVGPDGWNENLTPRLAGLEERVRRLGFVDRRDLSALLAGARSLVFPSLREGFGLPALEAMAQGTPVVGSAGTAIAEVIGDCGILVDPTDVAGWSEAMRTAAQPGWSDGQASAALDQAAGFTWERSAALTVEAYREVLG